MYTCFNNTSIHGYRSSILKSGICKYARRDEYNKLEWCIIELALFNLLKEGKAIVTNMINRLKILLMEDISFTEISVIYNCIILLNKYDNSRDDYNLLINIVYLLKKAKRNRLTSYMNNWWRYKHNKNDINKNIKLDKVLKYKKNDDSNYLLMLGENLINFIENKDKNIFLIIMKLINIVT